MKTEKTGKYYEVDAQGNKVVRWRIDKTYTKEGLRKMRDEFEKEAKQGKIINLTDLMINHGL